MTHINYRGIMEFNICTTMNNEQLRRNLSGCLNDLNELKTFDGDIENITFDKISLCQLNCLDEPQEDEESESDF